MSAPGSVTCSTSWRRSRSCSEPTAASISPRRWSRSPARGMPGRGSNAATSTSSHSETRPSMWWWGLACSSSAMPCGQRTSGRTSRPCSPAAAAPWLTVPVVRSGRSGQLIVDTECQPGTPWKRKHLATLQASYGRHACFREVFPVVEAALSGTSNNLADINITLIQALGAALGVTCRFARSSLMGVAANDATERLVALVGAVGGSSYLHGRGGLKYQEEELFRASSIKLVLSAFGGGPYPQKGSDVFIAGLSIIDALCNLGFTGTRKLFLSA